MQIKSQGRFFLYICLTFFLIIPAFNLAAGDELERLNSSYRMDFKVESSSYTLTRPGALSLIGYKDSKYIKEWYSAKMEDYRGPLLFNGYSSEDVKALQLYASYSDKELPYAMLVLSYRPQRKEWILQFNYFQHDYRIEAACTLDSGRLPVTIEGSDVTFSYPKKIEGVKIYTNGFSEQTTVSAISYRGKIYGTDGVERRNYGVYNWSNGSVFGKRGVSLKKELRFDFAKVLYLNERNLEKLAAGGVIDPDRKIVMDNSINYFYLNGRKVYGEWSEDGTELIYTPGEPYPAESKVTVVIPEVYSNIYGVKMEAPRYIYFYTGKSTVSTPYCYYASFDNRGGEIKIGWEPIENEKIDSYRIYRAELADGDYKLITEITEESWNYLNGTYTDRSVKDGKVYYYKMQALSGTEKSGFSDLVIGKTMAAEERHLNEWSSFSLDRARGEEQKYLTYKVDKGRRYSLNLEKSGSADIKVTVYYKDGDGLNFLDSSESPFTEPLELKAPTGRLYVAVEGLEGNSSGETAFKLLLLEN